MMIKEAEHLGIQQQYMQNGMQIVICCPEAIGYNNGWIDDEKLEEAANDMQKNTYGKYLSKVLKRGRK